MTTAAFYCKGKFFSATIKGHAEYNPGNDIVCASCSMLACTLAENLLRMYAAGEIAYADVQKQSGEMVITAEGDTNKMWHAVQALGIGFDMLAKKYPKNVRFSCRVGAKEEWPIV